MRGRRAAGQEERLSSRQRGAARDIDLVIVDCGGVLGDSETISFEVMRDALAGLGVGLSRAHFAQAFPGRGFPTVARSNRENPGVPLPDDFEARLRAALLARSADQLRPTPGVEAVLERLACRARVAMGASACSQEV